MVEKLGLGVMKDHKDKIISKVINVPPTKIKPLEKNDEI